MPAPRAALVVIASVIACATGCARRTDEAMRRAWEQSAGAGTRPGAAADPSAEGDDDESAAPRIKFGWERVDEVLTSAVDLLHIGPDDPTLARLAERWGAVEPVPQETTHGPVFVCHPHPPVSVDGHRMVLELGAPGVIGLVARDLTEVQSLTLTEQARKAAGRLCAEAWTPAPAVTARDGTLREEFHTCATLDGPMLTVGRSRARRDPSGRVRDGDDNRMERRGNVWQVSVAVLGTT
jgi:hypothetical protein